MLYFQHHFLFNDLKFYAELRNELLTHFSINVNYNNLSFKVSKSNEKPLFYLHINYDVYIHKHDSKTSIDMCFYCLCV